MSLGNRLRWLVVLVAASSLLTAWLAVPVPFSGRVLDAQGKPIVGASITPQGPAADVARSDSGGAYRAGSHAWPVGLPAQVRADGFQPAETRGGELVLHRWPWLAGVVVDEIGVPVPDADLTITAQGRRWQVSADSEGRFALFLAIGEASVHTTVTALGHEAWSGSAALQLDREATLAPKLARQLGTLTIITDPAGVNPLIDTRHLDSCQATPCQVSLPVGNHTVSVDDPVFVPWLASARLAKDGTVKVATTLVRRLGRLKVNVPGTGELALDGSQIGTGAFNADVVTGQHTLTYRSAATWPYRAAVEVQWQQATEVTLAPHPVTPGDPAGFLAELQAFLSATGGSFGVYLEQLSSGRTLAVGQDTSMEAASVIKIPVALYLLNQVDAGQPKLSDKVKLEARDFMGGTGILYGSAKAGDEISYQDLLADLIRQSDNTAWQALQRVLDPAKIDSFAAAQGAPDCHQLSDQCTARQAGQLLSKLGRGGLLSGDSTNRLIQLLETTVFNDRINYYLSGVSIAHKIGIDGNVINDCGIVYSSAGAFTICVFTRTADQPTGIQAIRDIARAAYRYYSR
ncbi:MAG: serine hydrolase [Candidatus Dormibacteraeota bacterium]|uniref:Serine hydrolase n=1 Tax=Candidatus Dormiibacter inghamiae TaxID=3127013 RepID=A0A934N6F2_9BACT|nr:serine hydrolase [Candidatus Dormibacteraeota bacterium]